MANLLFQAIAGVASLWLADRFIPGVEFQGDIKYLFAAGIILGLINHFIKPILKAATLPLRIFTLGLFGLIINIAIVWAVDILFEELIIAGIIPLLWTTLLVWTVSFFLGIYSNKKSKEK